MNNECDFIGLQKGKELAKVFFELTDGLELLKFSQAIKIIHIKLGRMIKKGVQDKILESILLGIHAGIASNHERLKEIEERKKKEDEEENFWQMTKRAPWMNQDWEEEFLEDLVDIMQVISDKAKISLYHFSCAIRKIEKEKSIEFGRGFDEDVYYDLLLSHKRGD